LGWLPMPDQGIGGGEPGTTIVRGGTVITNGRVCVADILIRDGRIAAIGERLRGDATIDASGCYVLPGLVDTHTHVFIDGDPSMAPVAQGLLQASRTAVLGGVTTLFAFTRSVPGRSLTQVVEAMLSECEGNANADFGLHALLTPDQEPEVLVEEALGLGITSFKAMLAYKRHGLLTSDERLYRLMEAVALSGGLVVVHAENGDITDYLESVFRQRGEDSLRHYLATSPPLLEAAGIAKASMFSKLTGCSVAFAHLSAEASADLARGLRAEGNPSLFFETQPHYALLSLDSIEHRGPLAKIGPPIREAADADAVVRAVRDGLVDVLSTDHSPRTSEKKRAAESIWDAPYGGISGLQLLLPLAGLIFGETEEGLKSVVRVTSENPSRILGLYPRKGTISVGSDADLVLVNIASQPKAIGSEWLDGPSDYSLYDGLGVRLAPQTVIRSGHVVVERGEILLGAPPGRFLTRLADADTGMGVR
jgi:dihydropyrimidinase